MGDSAQHNRHIPRIDWKLCAMMLKSWTAPVAFVLAGTVLLLAASVAGASDVSERLYSRGLVELQAGRHAAALTLFNQAIDADGGDIHARFYRGATRRQLGDPAGAIEDLRAVLAVQPDMPAAALQLGAALVENGAYVEAIPWLERAQAAPASEAEASLFLGLAQFRLDRLSMARQSFTRAEADAELRLMSRYYLGLVDVREGKLEEARTRFTQVVESSPDSAAGKEAADFLARMGEPELAADYRLYGHVEFQYDSNVVLTASEDQARTALDVSRQDDGSTSIQVGGVYVPWRNDRARLSVGYEFFQRFYFELVDFNLQDHRPEVQLTVDAGPATIGLLGRYDYYFLKTDSLLQEFAALPWISCPTGDIGRAEAFYRMRRSVFFEQPYDDFNDAFNHAVGVRQSFYVLRPEQTVRIGYSFDREDPTGRAGDLFGYDGHEVGVGMGWTFPAAISAAADYAYRHEDYSSDGRRDNEHRFLVLVRKGLFRHIDLVAVYFGTINDSNQPQFEYDRHVASLALEIGF